jgi:hypothetical protein
MKWLPDELGWRNLLSSGSGMGRGDYAVVAVLLSILVGATVLAGKGWSSAVGAQVPVAGYVAMALGIVFSMLVGVGLMFLVFYSSRAGYDEPAKLIKPDSDKTRE